MEAVGPVSVGVVIVIPADDASIPTVVHASTMLISNDNSRLACT